MQRSHQSAIRDDTSNADRIARIGATSVSLHYMAKVFIYFRECTIANLPVLVGPFLHLAAISTCSMRCLRGRLAHLSSASALQQVRHISAGCQHLSSLSLGPQQHVQQVPVTQQSAWRLSKQQASASSRLTDHLSPVGRRTRTISAGPAAVRLALISVSRRSDRPPPPPVQQTPQVVMIGRGGWRGGDDDGDRGRGGRQGPLWYLQQKPGWGGRRKDGAR